MKRMVDTRKPIINWRGRNELAKFRISHLSRRSKVTSVGFFALAGVLIGLFFTPYFFNPPLITTWVILFMVYLSKVLPELREINRTYWRELNAIRRKHGIPEKLP